MEKNLLAKNFKVVALLLSFLFLGMSGWATTYYLTAAGAANAQTPASWNTNPAGGGTAATNFTTNNDIFVIPSVISATFKTNTSTTFGNNVTLQVIGSFTIGSGSNNDATSVTINGTIVFSNNSSTQATIPTGGNPNTSTSFNLGSSGTLKTTNGNGIIGANCSLPIVSNHASVSLPTTANYEFNGTTSQATLGLPATVNTLTINNNAGVNLTAPAAITTSLTIGNITPNSIFNDNGKQITSNGTFNLTSGTFSIGNGATATTYPTFATNIINPTTTVNYASTSNQQIVALNPSGSSYGNLTNYSTLSNSTVSTGARTLQNSGVISIKGSFVPSTGANTTTNSTVSFNGTIAQTIPAYTFNNLTIDNPAGISSISGDVTVIQSFALTNGVVTTLAKTVIIGTAGSVSRTNGWVNGNLKQYFTPTNSQKFHVGSSTKYRPVDVVFATGATSGYLTATSVDVAHPQISSSGLNSAKSIAAYWKLASGITGTYNATFTYNTSSPSDVPTGAAPLNFVARNYSGTWNPPLTSTIPPTTGTTSATGLTTFGDFAIGETNGVPVVALQPTDQAVCVGGNASFTSDVQASTTTPPPTVKWQRSIKQTNGTYLPFEDIISTTDGSVYANFTTKTLSITNATFALNGYQYKPIYTNINGSSTNAVAATLTVTQPPTITELSYSGSPFANITTTPQTVTLSGTNDYLGGVFSSDANLTINTGTGAITPNTSTIGNHIVTYTTKVGSVCGTVSKTDTVTITSAPTATITYAGSPFCMSVTTAQPVKKTGTDTSTVGTYTSTPGLTIDLKSGEITPSSSTAGTYTVTYHIPASYPYPASTSTVDVIITAVPSVSISYTGAPYCTSDQTSQTVMFSNKTGAWDKGMFSASPTGLVINDTTGEFTPSGSAAGDYTITYTIPASGGCATVPVTSSVITIVNKSSGSISYTGSPFCKATTAATVTKGTGTPAGTFSSSPGLSINPSTGVINPSASDPGDYTVIYTIPASGPCGVVQLTAPPVTIVASPTGSFSYENQPFCGVGGSKPVKFSSDASGGYTGGTFSASPLGLSIDAVTGAISPASSAAGIYTVTYTTPNCPVTSTTTVEITAAPTATIGYAGPFCLSDGSLKAVTLNGDSTGTFSAPSGLSIDQNSGGITPSTGNSGTYTVTYTIPSNGTCPTITKTTSVVITAPPTANFSYDNSPYCTSLTSAQNVHFLSGNTTGTYSSSSSNLTLNSNGAITPSTSNGGNYTVSYNIPAAGGCAAVSVTKPVTITTLPTATISYTGGPFCISDASTYPVNLTGGTGAYTGGTFTSSPAGLSIDGFGNITPSGSAPGMYTVTYTIDASNGCSSVSVSAPSVVINALPTITGPSSVCVNGTTQLTGSGTAATTNAWTSSNTSIATVSNSGVVTAVTVGISSITYTNNNGCSISITITVNPLPSPTISAGGPTTLCAPGSVLLSSSSAASYQWFKGGTIISGANAQSYPANASGNYTVSVTNDFGCTATSAATSVTLNPLPTITTSSSAGSVCISTSAQATNLSYSAITNAPTKYNITWNSAAQNAGFLNVTNATLQANSITINIPAGAAAATYIGTVTVQNGNGCISGSANNFNVTVNAKLATTITYSKSGYCIPDLEKPTPTVTGVSGGIFSATPSSGLSINNLDGTITVGSSTPGIYTITYTPPVGACATASTTTVSIGAAINPGSSSWAAFPTCSGSGIQLQSTGTPTGGSGNFTYQWLESDGNCGNPHFAPGMSTGSTYIVPSGHEVNCFTLMISSGGCSYTYSTKGKANSLVIGSNAITFGSSATTICFGSSTTLTATSNVSYTYSWSPATGLSSTTGTSVTANPTTTTTYTVTGTATSGPSCTKTANVTVTVNPLATLSGVSTSAACSGTNETINLTGLLASSTSTINYNIAGGSTQTAVVVSNTSGSGSFPVAVTLANNGQTLTITSIASGINSGPACSQTFSSNNTTILAVNPLPTATISGSGTPICQNSTTPTITFTGATGTAPYTFTYNITNGSTTGANQTATSGGGSNPQSATITAPTGTAGTFTYNLVSVQGQFCSQAILGQSVPVVVNPITTITAQPISPATICEGAGTATFTVTAAGTGTLTYQWQESTTGINGTFNNVKDGGVYGGTNTATLSITNPTFSMKNYAYHVVVIGDCSSVTSNGATLSINQASNGGHIDNSATVCSGNNAASVSTVGLIGSVVEWQSSKDNFSADITHIANTTAYQSYSNLTQTTYYRAVVNSGGTCASAYSTIGKITVVPQPISATLTPTPSAGPVCEGATVSATATAGSGGDGTITDVLQYRYDGGAWSDYTSGTPLSTTGHTSVDIQTYRTASTGGCNTSNVVVVSWTVSLAPKGGQAKVDTKDSTNTVCSGANGIISTVNLIGGVIEWQSSTDNFVNASTITHIPNSSHPQDAVYSYTYLSYSNLTQTTYYRAMVGNGVCTPVYSTTVVGIVNSPASITAQPVSTTVCPNSTTSFTVSVNGTIAKYQWQVSIDGGNTFSNIVDASQTTYQGINSNTLTINNASTNLSNYQYKLVITGASPCTSNPTSNVVTLTVANTWTGVTSSDWNDGTNWSCGRMPLATENAIIPSVTNMPSLTAATTINNLTIQGGATVTLASQIFNINGNVSGGGKFISDVSASMLLGGDGSGTLNFDQTANGTTNAIKNLTVNTTSASPFILGSDLYIINSLTLNGGELVSGGHLTIRSTSNAATAYVAPVANGAKITGDVTVERFIPERRAFRFLSPSVTTTSSIKANWMENAVNAGVYPPANNPNPGFGTNITGPNPTANGFDPTVTNNPSFFTYNSTGTNQAWVTVPNTNGTLTAGDAYRLLIRGSRSTDMSDPSNFPTPTNTTLRAKGTLFVGDYNVNGLSTIPNGYTFVGNPYASPIDFENILANSSHDIDSVYVGYDPYLNARGGFVHYDVRFHTTIPYDPNLTKNIQSGQAFFVQTGGPSPSLQFSETSKTTGNSNVFRTASINTRLAVNLLLNNNGGVQNTADGIMVVFDDNFSNRIGNKDSYKISNQDENIAINHSDTLLSIEGRHIVTNDDTIHLKLWQFRQKEYVLRFKGTNFSPSVTAFIRDSYLRSDTAVDLASGSDYRFTITSDSASFAPNRFMIVFKTTKVLPVTLTHIKAYTKDKGIQVDWTAETEINIGKYEVEKSLDGEHFASATTIRVKANNGVTENYGWFDDSVSIGNNYYRIKVTELSGAIKYSEIVVVNISGAKSSITIYPNPIKGSVIAVHMNNMKKGRYIVNLYNGLGQKLHSSIIEHNGGNATYQVMTKNIISKGAYKLHITDGESQTTETVLFE